MTDLDSALHDEASWRGLVEARSAELGHFLRWAAACEENRPETSLRFRHRDDIKRCRSVLKHFYEPWWGVVVYSCFDSVLGATTAAADFSSPLASTDAPHVVDAIDWPHGSVAGHRKQCGNRGATASLVSACEKATDLENVLCETSRSFEERFAELKQVDVAWWGRTTRFDVLARAGPLEIAGETYEPALAHLAGATGPKKGFEKLWGVQVTKDNAEQCEALLRKWRQRWDDVTHLVHVAWPGQPYTPADFENALCIFQEPPHPHLPDPADFADESRPRPPARDSTGRSC